MLSLNETSDGLARTSGVQWYRSVLRKNGNGFLKRLLDFKVFERIKRRPPKMTWKMRVEKQIKTKLEDATDKKKWHYPIEDVYLDISTVYKFSGNMRKIWPVC